jgi:hypothetical protein
VRMPRQVFIGNKLQGNFSNDEKGCAEMRGRV